MGTVDDLRLAFDASALAAELALAHFQSGVSVTLKADGTPVTEADQAVERLLRETLSPAPPGDAFLGEELGQLGESDRIWILDPIDGTGFFSRGDPDWRIHIALEVDGAVDLAVVTSRALRRCWWATRGGGSFESSWPREQSKTRHLNACPTDATTDVDPGAVVGCCGQRLARMPPSTGKTAPVM
jgi:histidinol-phosphatase